MKKINTVIVGQGIAGSLVAFMLHRKKIPFLVIDPATQHTASKIAAGMFTPLSGKRKTIHPLVLEQIPFAIKIYQEISQLLGYNIVHLSNIYQVFNSAEEQSAIQLKSLEPVYSAHIVPVSRALPGIFQQNGACEITHSGWVNCELWMGLFRTWLKKNERLLETSFIHQDLQISEEKLAYRGLEFQNIFFCEGYRAIDNPFFNEKIIPCKGDVLTIASNDFATDQIIKKNGIYLVPSESNAFKVGATYQWNNDTEPPDKASKLWIESQLENMLINSFITIDHQSAIRPTTQNREVIIQQHLQHKGIFMLNGLGTKGVLQGPWWSNRIVELCMQSTSE
jgi:glycine/D-amino acid oxidase-like deaminating enzyme